MFSACPGDSDHVSALGQSDRQQGRQTRIRTRRSKPIATPAARPVTTRSSISAAGICWRGILISTSLPVCCTAMRGLIEPCAARALPPLGRGIGGRSWRYVSSGMSSVLIMWWRKEAGADAAMASRSASGHWCWLPIAWRAPVASMRWRSGWRPTLSVIVMAGVGSRRGVTKRNARPAGHRACAWRGGNCSNGIARSSS